MFLLVMLYLILKLRSLLLQLFLNLLLFASELCDDLFVLADGQLQLGKTFSHNGEPSLLLLLVVLEGVFSIFAQ